MSRCGRLAVVLAAVLLSIAPQCACAGFMQSYQATGNLGLEVSAVDANPNAGQINSLSGTFSLSQIPPAVPIQKALVYSHDWSGGTLTLSFNNTVIPGGPFQSDLAFLTLTAYMWDVTNFLVPVPPFSYSFNIQSSNQLSQIAGAALVVVWQDPLAPFSTVTIVDGARQVGEHTPAVTDTETATFVGLPAGPTNLFLFTVSDDATGTGEVVRYNGGPNHGPIDANLGFSASLIQFSDTSLAGTNTVSITSSADHFGWLISASIVTVPEPESLTLLVTGLVGVAGAGWSRRKSCRCGRTQSLL